MCMEGEKQIQLETTTGHRRRIQGGRGGPIFYLRDFINVYTCSADRRDRRASILRSAPPKWNCFLRLCWNEKTKKMQASKLKVKVVAHTKETQADARCYQQIQREVLAES